MKSILTTEAFGIIVTIIFFNLGIYLNKKLKTPIANPLLVSIVGIVIFLNITKIPYENYKIGGDMINFFLGPVTIVLALPLYRQFGIFKKYIREILTGISVGVVMSFISISIIGAITDIDIEIVNSLIPKSITTPMGVSLSNTIGGISSITIVSIIMTGILGAIIAPYIFKLGNIKHSISKGIALGTSSHALGTTKALEMGEVEGAMSGLSIGIAGVITVVIIPILINLM